MEDMFKKIISTSLGAALLAKNKMSELINELVSKGAMSEEEGKKFIDDLKAETEKSSKDIEEELNKIVANTLKRLNVPTRQDIERLEKRIKILEQNMEENNL